MISKFICSRECGYSHTKEVPSHVVERLHVPRKGVAGNLTRGEMQLGDKAREVMSGGL